MYEKSFVISPFLYVEKEIKAEFLHIAYSRMELTIRSEHAFVCRNSLLQKMYIL